MIWKWCWLSFASTIWENQICIIIWKAVYAFFAFTTNVSQLSQLDYLLSGWHCGECNCCSSCDFQVKYTCWPQQTYFDSQIWTVSICIHLLIFRKPFFVRVTNNLELIAGTLGARQKYTLKETAVHIHTLIYTVQHRPACFWEVGGKQKTKRRWTKIGENKMNMGRTYETWRQ